jgi:hypothetical protein
MKKFVCNALAALVACQGLPVASAAPPLTENDAVRAAATCMGWSSELKLESQNDEDFSDPLMYFNFPVATNVTIHSDGTCTLDPSRPLTFAARVVRLPQHFVATSGHSAGDQVWILFLAGSNEKGDLTLIAMHGLIGRNYAPVVLPPERVDPKRIV